jgi:hypothetical protein
MRKKGHHYIDIWRLALGGSGRVKWRTHFNDYPGYKAPNSVVSDAGPYMAFQTARIRAPRPARAPSCTASPRPRKRSASRRRSAAAGPAGTGGVAVPPRAGAASLFAGLAAWVVTLHAVLILVLPVAVLGVKAPLADGGGHPR